VNGVWGFLLATGLSVLIGRTAGMMTFALATSRILAARVTAIGLATAALVVGVTMIVQILLLTNLSWWDRLISAVLWGYPTYSAVAGVIFGRIARRVLEREAWTKK
jgi:hypothetical protein